MGTVYSGVKFSINPLTHYTAGKDLRGTSNNLNRCTDFCVLLRVRVLVYCATDCQAVCDSWYNAEHIRQCD